MGKPSISAPIAVIGMACRYPGADNLKTFWENILTRKRQFRTMPDIRLPLADYYDPDPAAPDKTYTTKAAFIDGYSFDWAGHRIPKSTVDSTDIAQWLALDVALAALRDSGLSSDSIPKNRTGTILGNSLTGEQTRAEGLRLRWPFVRRTLETAAKAKGLMPKTTEELLQTMEKYYKSVFAPITEDTLAGGMSNTIAGRICNYLDIHGGGYTVDGACSSSLVAVATAANSLTNGDLDIALAGGVDISLDTFELIGFAKTGALSKSDMRVYDRRSDGFLPGEGCGFVVLQRLEDAIIEKNYIYAVLRGWGISSDGKGGLTAPSAQGQALALKRAYDRAGYDIREVDFFEGHGTGTAVGDKAELEGIALALGEEEETPLRPHGITSFKSIVGHTKAASGIGGFMKAVMAVNRRILPPTANCADPNPIFNDTARSIYPILTGEILPAAKKLKAGISAMGFGGINCHVTIESNDAPSGHLAPELDERKLIASRQETELFVMGASSIPQLIDRTREILQLVPGMSEGELVDLASQLSKESGPDASVRASIITGSQETLLKSLTFLENKLTRTPPAQGETFTSRRKDIYIGNAVQQCRVGFLFPGQGSQVLNMGKTLADRHDWARERINNADEWLSKTGGTDVVQSMFKPLDRAGGNKEVRKWREVLKRTEIAQPALCLTSLLWTEKLARLGIRPNVVGGHSLGELTAFYAAGVFDEETLIQFASIRGQAMAAPLKESGTMASLSCPVETAAEIINSGNGYAVVANINSPKQTVISGDNQCISEAVKLAKDRGITTHILPVSNAFHSKYAQKAADLLRTKAPIPQTADHFKIKLFSCMNGKEILPSHNLPDHFADQALSPVDFISLIASMAGECDLMVEVGPGKVLTNLTHAIIHEKTPVCLPIEAKPGQDRDLNTFLGKYFIRGGAIHFEALYEDRLIRPFVPAAQRSFIENPCERPFDATIAQEQITPEVAEMIDSTLAKAIDISPRELTEYLSIRSNFLETIIKGDIGNLPLYQAAADLLPETEEKRIITSAQPPAPHHEKSPETKTESTDTGTEILYALLEKITGFPAQSLTLDLRLLDDLNLDSIKAGDLIAKFSQELGVGGQVDPAAMANATLAEIINTIGELAAGDMVNKDQETVVETDWNTDSILSIVKQGVAALIGRPVESFQAEARSGPDLKMSLEHLAELLHHISKELKAELNLDLPPLLDRTLTQLAVIVGRLLHNRLARQTPPQTIEHRPWVREIHAELVQTPAPLSELYQGKRYEDNWRHAQVLLLNSEATGEVADVLKSLLNSLGAGVTLQEYYKGFDPDAVKNASLYSHLIVVLPQEAGEPVAADGQLEEMISRLASIASPPHAATAPRRRTTVAYIQFGGGSFGMHSTAGYLNTCCASALAKSLHLERDDLRVRVLDFDPKAAPAAIAEKITFEMHTVDDFAAVGYDRSLVRRELKQHLLQPADYRNRSFSWTQEDVILVTGGAKGITAACALGLAKETGARMALLGRTPHSHDQPDADIAETLKKYEEAGCSAQYFSCDVSDQTSVHDVVQKIRANMGPITGVIHGAGLNVPRLVNQVSVQEALQEVSPKILGILNLMTELKDTPPRLLVGLSSIIGVTGMPGNGWYGFSNEALDILLHRIEADFPQTKTLSVAYSIWQEEGMGARMGSVKALKQKGIDAIPTEEGVKRFVRLFIKDPGVPQVIIAARLSGLNTFQWQTEIPEPQGRFLEKPLHITPGVESVFQTHLSLETDTYLKDHVFNGSYLFPTVFGLEAMAQAVAHVTGQNDFSRIRIENIQLKRPITVDPESGADIVVWAELIESETPSDVQTVEAGVYKQGSGPKLGFFKATFVLGLEHEHVTYKINLPENPLDIVPKEDLYNGRLLFQGPQFQRLQEIYSLDSKQCIFNTAFKPSDVNNKEQQWLLGDPFFRDSLLHSTQLPVSQHICLPVSIESIERFPVTDIPSDSIQGETVITKQTAEEVHGTVLTVNNRGQGIERLNGYVLKVMEFHQDYPTPEEIVDPSQRDEMIIESEIKKRSELLGMSMPAISVANLPGLKELTKEERHKRELPILEKAVHKLINNNSQTVHINWLDTGKPVLESETLSKYRISLSHDRETVVCTAGKGIQGCDIESITSRTREEWIALLSKNRAPLLDELVGNTDSIDQAGTRIWTAMEAGFKAIGSKSAELQIEKQEGDSVLFRARGSDEKDISIVTFPLSLSRGQERMIAIVIHKTSHSLTSISPNSNKLQTKLPSDYGYDSDIFGIDVDEGPQGQMVYVQRFPATFKTFQNPSRSIYFTAYFRWMGDVREYALYPVMDRLHSLSATGGWGLATNSAETHIYSDIKGHDIVESRLWMDRELGNKGSTFDWIFEWRKLLREGGWERIALSRLQTTWVQIVGHGVANQASMPDFLDKFIGSMKPTQFNTNNSDLFYAKSRQESNELGQVEVIASEGPEIGPELYRDIFKTSLEDSNLVGNIYFINYALWQGRVRDQYFYSLSPNLYRGIGEEGEFRCRWVKVNHLREAMPFDNIQVSMHLRAVYENGVALQFQFYRIDKEGERIKLASAEHEAVWMVPTLDGKAMPSLLPEKIRCGLLDRGVVHSSQFNLLLRKQQELGLPM